MFDLEYNDGIKKLYPELKAGLYLGLEGAEIENVSISNRFIYFYLTDGFQFKVSRRFD